MLSLYMPYSIW